MYVFLPLVLLGISHQTETCRKMYYSLFTKSFDFSDLEETGMIECISSTPKKVNPDNSFFLPCSVIFFCSHKSYTAQPISLGCP